jgi:catalase
LIATDIGRRVPGYGGPVADPARTDDGGTWYADGDMVRTAYTLRPEDDDFGQAGTLVRDVLDDAARARLVSNIAGHLLNGVSEPVLLRAFAYWRNVDKNLGDRIEHTVRGKQNDKDPKAAQQVNPARDSMQAKA